MRTLSFKSLLWLASVVAGLFLVSMIFNNRSVEPQELQFLQRIKSFSIKTGSYKITNFSTGKGIVYLKSNDAEFERWLEIQRQNIQTLSSKSALKYRPKSDFVETYPPSLNAATNQVNSSVKRILAWTNFFDVVDWIPKEICKGLKKTCVSTTNKADISKVDGIVVHPRDLKSRHDLPSSLLPHQRLIYLLQESPYNTGINVGDYNGVFNWTSTYRTDSDSPFRFISIAQKDTPLSDIDFNKISTEILASKPKLVAYMNSNCVSPHTTRLKYIEELKKHIHVDTYGKCGTLNCPRKSEECTKIMSEYKFYLSMESGNCRDYLTEKVHQPLFAWRSVPVVMGGSHPSDYENLLPPNSYIHTAAFANASQLAEYLLFLDKNPDQYERYHRWRKTHQSGRHDMWCDMCEKLHDPSLPNQVYKDFKGWYQQDVCIV